MQTWGICHKKRIIIRHHMAFMIIVSIFQIIRIHRWWCWPQILQNKVVPGAHQNQIHDLNMYIIYRAHRGATYSRAKFKWGGRDNYCCFSRFDRLYLRPTCFELGCALNLITNSIEYCSHHQCNVLGEPTT